MSANLLSAVLLGSGIFLFLFAFLIGAKLHI